MEYGMHTEGMPAVMGNKLWVSPFLVRWLEWLFCSIPLIKMIQGYTAQKRVRVRIALLDKRWMDVAPYTLGNITILPFSSLAV